MLAPEERLTHLEERVAELEERMPVTSICSRSFFARAFAVWGHFIVAHLIIGVPIAILYVVAMLIFVATRR